MAPRGNTGRHSAAVVIRLRNGGEAGERRRTSPSDPAPASEKTRRSIRVTIAAMRYPISALTALALGAFLGLSTVGPAYAQHETAADLLDGERAYQASCANCHGPNGDLVAGIDLFRGRFRRPLSDEELVRIIRTGIPNTPMPATNMTAEQASKIVAYLRSLAAKATGGTIAGDAARGKVVFDSKGKCTSCHSVGGVGARVGP